MKSRLFAKHCYFHNDHVEVALCYVWKKALQRLVCGDKNRWYAATSKEAFVIDQRFGSKKRFVITLLGKYTVKDKQQPLMNNVLEVESTLFKLFPLRFRIIQIWMTYTYITIWIFIFLLSWRNFSIFTFHLTLDQALFSNNISVMCYRICEHHTYCGHYGRCWLARCRRKSCDRTKQFEDCRDSFCASCDHKLKYLEEKKRRHIKSRRRKVRFEGDDMEIVVYQIWHDSIW